MSSHWEQASDLAEAFGVVLEGARVRRDMTLVELARALGVKASHLWALERGLVEPTLSMLIRLAMALGLSPLWLLEEMLAWRAASEATSGGKWENSRDARLRATGEAAVATLLACSPRELTIPSVVGQHLVNRLALAGLMVTAIPFPPYPPLSG